MIPFFKSKDKENKEANTMTVKGFTFKVSGNGTVKSVPLAKLAELYLVMKAIGGDELAREILDQSGKVIIDADGNQIYPIVSDK